MLRKPNFDINVDGRTDGRTNGRTNGRTDERTEIWTPISHPAISRCDKNNNLGFEPGPTQTSLYSQISRLEVGFKKRRDCSIHIVKTKALNSFAV